MSEIYKPIKYRVYRYKFYLDANHYIFTPTGEPGMIHPHTWEFAVELKNKNGDFVIWYVEKNGKIIHYDKHSKDNSMAVKFQWNCLMRGGLA